MLKYVHIIFALLLCVLTYSQQPKLILPIGHTESVNTAQFSPDAKKVVTVSKDETAKIWDATSGLLLADLKGHTDEVYSAQFSSDGKKIVTASNDKTVKIWDAERGLLLIDLKGNTVSINSAQFSPNGKKIVTASDDSTVKIWDAASGQLLANLKGHLSPVHTAQFSFDSKKIVTTSWESSDNGTTKITAKLWDATSGLPIADFKWHTAGYNFSVQFSPDGKKILTASDSVARLWDAGSGLMLADLKGHKDPVTSAQFSPDGKKIITISIFDTKVWDATSGLLLITIGCYGSSVTLGQFSPDSKKIVIVYDDLIATAKIWDAFSGLLLADLKGHTDWVQSAQFSSDGKKIVITSSDGTAKVWDVASGLLLADLKGHTKEVSFVQFSSDGKKIVTASNNGYGLTKVWDASSGSLLANYINLKGWIDSAQSSPDGKKKVTYSDNYTAKVWEVKVVNSFNASSDSLLNKHMFPFWDWDVLDSSNNTSDFDSLLADHRVKSLTDTRKITIYSDSLLVEFTGHTSTIKSAQFSPDGKRIVTASRDSTAIIWDMESGLLLANLIGHTGCVYSAHFSADGKKIVTASDDRTAKVWNATSGLLLTDLKGHMGWVISARFSPNGKNIVTASYDNTCKLWNAETGELLYTFFAIDSTDYLVVDKYNRYDGTEGARKLIYFTCGTEVISLDQVKDSLWVPNLAERIMRGEPINSPKLSDLNLCGLTPVVENINNSTNYTFNITPRRGGLGETALYVNGIEVKRYQPAQLSKKATDYQLTISKASLQPYFVTGKSNTITVKVFTAANDIASRGVSLVNNTTGKNSAPANLYAVMVGVSDYKGTALDLKYAAKDARDLSNAVAASAKKLLNSNGVEHVFMYNIHTGENRTQFPEKRTIQQVFEDIGKKATANDILLIFFAGHGVMAGKKEQFYFLTADASPNSDIPATGISIAELNEWMKPEHIKAQKRILILDACNSGQAINDLVTIGNKTDNYVKRSDEESNRIKAVEKLNERSGMMILSASASNQSAYELSKYSQGLLTYALLKAIKQQPDILEDGQYLNVDKWFIAAEKQ